MVAYEQSRDVLLVRGDERCRSGLFWSRQPGGPSRVELDSPIGMLIGRGDDLFEALVALRCQLEPAGWLIAVQGACRDTFPSGMLRDMGGARKVYILRLGEHAERSDMVRTFDDADPALLATVDIQRTYYEEWHRQKPPCRPPDMPSDNDPID